MKRIKVFVVLMLVMGLCSACAGITKESQDTKANVSNLYDTESLIIV